MTTIDAPARIRTSEIAQRLGVTRAGLEWLAEAHASRDGHASRRGGEVEPLERTGYVEGGSYPVITEAGRVVVRQARGMGW